MEALNVEIINPKVKEILQNLAEMNLIRIEPQLSLTEMLARLRRHDFEIPTLEEITQEVEKVREARYGRKTENNYRH